jgi:hypothetical protein
MSGQPVVVILGRDQRTWLPEKLTGQDGVAVFHLQPPVAEWINVREVSERIWNCQVAAKNTFATADVLANGARALNICDKKGKVTGKITAQPGEVVLFARPLRFWEQ